MMDARITTLTYHALDPGDGATGERYALSEAATRAQFDWLRRHAVRCLGTADLVDALSGRLPVREPAVAITLDDGLASAHDLFAPLLHEFGLTATVFVVAGCVDGHNDWDAPTGAPRRAMMSKTQVRALSDAGIEIGGHGMTHVRLSGLPASALGVELRDSKAMLEDMTGRPVRYFAYPYGSYSAATVQAVREAGYLAAFTSDAGRTRPGHDLHTLRRVGVHDGDSMADFDSKVRWGGPLRAAVKRRVKDWIGRP